MRIDELRLTAFGPFTDVALDLRGGSEGFHLIYGPNEAGKSSALRALRQLFYGIPMRSTDNFIHSHANLRIGASLRTADGQTLSFIRRKGRLNTLRGPDDETVLDEAPLQGILTGIDADLFATMFGIGYEDLVRGGRDILKGGGDVGRLVFAAGSGIANLREIQTGFQDDADRLFRPNGQKQVINGAIAKLNRLKKDLKAAQLPGSEWLRRHQALEASTTRKTQVQADLDEKRKGLNRLRRIHRALPLITARKGLLNDLAALGAAVRLPEDFPEKRRKIVSELAHAETRQRQAAETIDACTRQIEALAVSSELLDSGERIEEIHLELGSQGKATLDRVQLVTRRATVLSDAREMLKELSGELTAGDADRLHIKKSEAERIRTLSTRHERIITRIEEAEKTLPDILLRISGIDAELTALAEPLPYGPLADALAEAAPHGPQEEANRAAGIALSSQLKTLSLLAGRLGLAEVPLDALETLRVPARETIRVFEERLEARTRHVADIRTELEKTRAALEEAESRIETLQLTREVPTETDLSEIRGLRDAGWRLIAGILAGDAPPAASIREFIDKIPGAASLAQAFEITLHRADATADRLRREADRVATKARLMAERVSLTHRIQGLETDFAAAETLSRQTHRDWTDKWRDTGIDCRSPREMAQWAAEFASLLEKAGAYRTEKAQFEALALRIEAHRDALARCLGEPVPAAAEPRPALSTLIKKAQTFIARQEALTQQHAQLLRDRQKLDRELQTVRGRIQSGREALREWTDRWETALSPIGLGGDARPEEAQAVMDAVQQRAEKLREAAILQKRIEGIDRDAEAFARKVAEVAEVVARDLAPKPATEAAIELHHRLKRSREAWTRRESLEKQAAQAREHHGQAGREAAERTRLLEEMCREAGCASPDELPEAEQRSHRRRKLEADLAAIDEQLALLSGGAGVLEFIAEALAIDPDGIAAQMGRLEETIEALARDTSTLDQAIGSERAELARMDGGGAAADIAEEIQVTLGGIESHVGQYARLKIAARLLNLAIERYRDKSQGPTLKRASRLFGRITGGAFSGIRAEYDENGQPVMVGVRQDGQICHVATMSDGTADQLYLALRLAGLEMYLAHSEPIPFIVDDILIQFDNARAEATLGALAELSEQTQLIFFTHHRHLVEMAERCIPPARLFHHTL